MTRPNVFDQDTLKHLRAQGVGDELYRRVEAAMQDSAQQYVENRRITAQAETMAETIRDLQDQLAEREPQVAWIIPLSYARELVDFLHRNMPGGYGEHHDNLRRAIQDAAAS